MRLIKYTSFFLFSIVSLTGCQQYQATTQDEINQLQTRVNDLQNNIQLINEQLDNINSPALSGSNLTLQPGEATNLIVESADPNQPVVQITNIEPVDSTKPTNIKSEIAGLSQNLPASSATSRYKGKKYILVSGVSTSDVQLALTNAGYNPGAIDGKIGSRTIAAVKRFQRSEKLKVDGVVGKQTWSRLVKHL